MKIVKKIMKEKIYMKIIISLKNSFHCTFIWEEEKKIGN